MILKIMRYQKNHTPIQAWIHFSRTFQETVWWANLTLKRLTAQNGEAIFIILNEVLSGQCLHITNPVFFGVTFKATVVWLIVMLIGELVAGITNKYGKDADGMDSEFVQKIKKNKEEFRTFEDNMKKALTILLGFFVTQNIRRWWHQTSRIPYLTDLAIACNAIFQHGPRGEESCKKTIRDFLRLAGLSYAIVMKCISNQCFGRKVKFVNFLRKKELATEEELEKLGFLREELDENYFTANGGAMQKWWIPIIWASRIIQKEQLKDGHLPKEGKEIASRLVRFKMDLEFVADYSQRPLPAIAKQAVNFVFWATLIVGTLDNKKITLNLDGTILYWICFSILMNWLSTSFCMPGSKWQKLSKILLTVISIMILMSFEKLTTNCLKPQLPFTFRCFV